MAYTRPGKPTTAAEREQPPLSRLLEFLRPDRGDVWAVVVFAMVIGGLLLATPIAVQALVNFVAFGGARTPILVLALLLACGLGLAAVLTAVQTWIVEILQRRLFVRTVADLAYRLPRMGLGRKETSYGPELVNRFFDLVTVQKTVAFLLLDGLSVVLGISISMIVLAFYHPLLLAFDVVILLAIGVIVYGLGRRGIQTAIRESKAKYAMEGWLEEIARQRVTFHDPVSRSYVVERTDSLARDYVESRRSHYTVLFRQILGALSLQVTASVALLGLGGLLVVRGELTLGQLVAAELIVTYVVGSVAKLGKHFEAFYDLMAATDKLGELFDLELERGGEDAWSAPAGPQGTAVVARNLRTASSSSWADTPWSFELEPGERVALTDGNTSALLDTLYGIRSPVSGTVQIDGLDARTLNVDALRQRVSLVSRPEVFEGTLRDNILFGSSISAEALNAALRCAQLQEDMLKLPDGLDTHLTSDGAPLSQQQLVKVAIVRAVVSAPSLLLIDGLLDALPTAVALPIARALVDRGAGWTLILATRRTEIRECCDRQVDPVRLPEETTP